MNNPRKAQRRDDSLSRERIIHAAIEILDESGEAGLTFRALAERLVTGAGAIYWHVDNKRDLLTAACDQIIAATLDAVASTAKPAAKIRLVAGGMFDAMDTHPWVGSALTHAPGKLPTVRLLDRLGQEVRAMGVAKRKQWETTSALLHYILGVGGQNAANAQIGKTMGGDREALLTAVAEEWLALDATMFPFAHSMAVALPGHDDRGDFLAGVDLILKGAAA